MKKVSAFSVFGNKSNTDKKGKAVPSPVPSLEDASNIKRASSTPTISKKKTLLKALRSSVRGSGQKVRPSILKTKGQSPHVAVETNYPVTQPSLMTGEKPSGQQKSSPSVSVIKPPVDRTKKPQLTANLTSKPPLVAQAMLETVKGKSAMLNGLSEMNQNLVRERSLKRQIKSPVSGPSAAKKCRRSPVASPVDGKQPKPGKNASPDSNMPNDKTAQKDTKRMSIARVDSLDHKPADMPYMFDSTMEATKMFECLIHPVTPDRFFKELWEKKPLLVKRHLPDYNRGMFSTSDLDNILRQENIQFGINLDITSFKNDKRETHNPSGRAHAPVVWDFYQKGCSVRLLNPQTYSRNVWKMLSVLQEYFNCSVGANVYLTPPNTQGFAPHYDDIEAFIIQLEGRKLWKLYNPRTDEEILPRFSSENFSQAEVGNPILDVVLEPGDLLYFPRGTIHQACANNEDHSLHLTFSSFQRNTWGDLFQQMMPRAIELALEENVEFRKGLPRDYLQYMGIVHAEKETMSRKNFSLTVEKLFKSLLHYLPIDAACDQMGKQAIHDALPPVLTEREKACSIYGAGEYWNVEQKQVRGVVELEPDTQVRIIRRGIIRMLTENDEVRIYHTLENARVYHGNTPQYVEIMPKVAPAVEFLIDSYPGYISIDNFPLETLDEKLDLASLLYDKGLLMTSEPLLTLYDEGDEDSDKGS